MGPHNHLKSKRQFARRRNNQGRRKQTIRLSGSRPCPHHARVPERTGAERVQSAGDSLYVARACARGRTTPCTPCAAAVGLPLQLATNGLRAVSPVQLEAFRLEPLRSDHGLERPVLPQLLVLLVGQPARHLHASRTVAWVWRAGPCTAKCTAPRSVQSRAHGGRRARRLEGGPIGHSELDREELLQLMDLGLGRDVDVLLRQRRDPRLQRMAQEQEAHLRTARAGPGSRVWPRGGQPSPSPVCPQAES